MNAVDERINQIRRAEVELKVTGLDGSPLRNQEVRLEQTRHKFLFGVGGFDIVALVNAKSPEEEARAAARVDRLTALCNFVTLPFYWARFEPVRGEPKTVEMRKAAEWCQAHGLRTKGHPLCWHTLAPDWLLPMSNKEILEAQLGRIRREVSGFEGLIDTWDGLNEAVIMPVFDKYDNGLTRVCQELGRIELIRRVFEEAHETNPRATLILNDFDMSPAYDILVEGCLEAGILIDAIGLQSHMHQGYWGVEKTEQILEHFTRFGLPIHFSETTLVSGHLMPPEIVDLNDYQVSEWPSTPEGEERQREETITHYKTLMAHPLVTGITWWDLADGGWLGAPAGLIRKDGSPKPAYESLLGLVKGEWWLEPTNLITDEEGKVRFTGFLGEYALEAGGKRTTFQVNAAMPTIIDVRV